MKKLSIPFLSDEELMRRYLKIKPIAQINGTKHWLRSYSLKELRTLPYFWYIGDDKREPVNDALSNHIYHDFECLHRTGYPGFFKPQIADILAQIPPEIFNNYTIDAFEIISSPINTTDLNKHKEALHQGFHVSVVRLYIKTQNT